MAKKKVKHLAPLESEPYRALMAICGRLKIDQDRVNELLWVINAEGSLTSLIRILQNLSDVITQAQESGVTTTRRIEVVAPWRPQLNRLLENIPTLIEECGTKLLAGQKGKGDIHPLHGFCLVRNPLYALLWNRADVQALKEMLLQRGLTTEEMAGICGQFESDFRLLQWHLFVLHQDLMQEIPLEHYLSYAGDKALYGRFNSSVNKSCQAAREYSHAEYQEMLSRLKVKQGSVAFFSKMDSASRDELDPPSRHFKTVATKWISRKHRRRSVITRRRKSRYKRRTTAYYVEFGDNAFISESTPPDDIFEIDTPDTRLINEIDPVDGWQEADLPQDELVDDLEEQVLVSVACTKRRSQRDQIMAAIGMANKRAVLNQHLPIHFDFMTVDEIAATMQRLGHVANDKGSDKIERRAAKAGILMYWTGSSIDRIRNLVVAPTEASIAPDVNLAYLLERRVWRVLAPVYKTSKESTPLQQSLCRASGEHLYLPDLWNAHRWLMDKHESDAHAGAKVFEKPFEHHRVATYDAALRKILKPLRDDGMRISPQRLSRDLLYRMQCRGDPVDASIITGQAHLSAATARHYSAPSMSHLVKTYRDVVSPLIDKIRHERYRDREDITELPEIHSDMATHAVGAQHCPTVEEVNNLLQRVRGHITAAESAAEYHLYYTLYTTLLIGYCTGYRAVRDIRLDASCRDTVTESAWISDKDNQDGYHTRRIWLAPVLEQQLLAYESYRRMLLVTWESHFPHIQRPNPDTTPYLFLPANTGILPVSSASVGIHLEALGYPLPLNSNRRFLRTELSERGCAIDVIDSFMGHWRMGQEPHGPYSCLSPRRQREQLRKYLIPLLEEIEVVSVKSRLAQ